MNLSACSSTLVWLNIGRIYLWLHYSPFLAGSLFILLVALKIGWMTRTRRSIRARRASVNTKSVSLQWKPLPESASAESKLTGTEGGNGLAKIAIRPLI